MLPAKRGAKSLTFQPLEGVLIDVGNRIALQFQGVQQDQMTEDAGRYLGELIVGQDKGIQILKPCSG